MTDMDRWMQEAHEKRRLTDPVFIGKKVVVHNQDTTVEEMFEGFDEEDRKDWLVCIDPPKAEDEEVWVHTFYIPLGQLPITSLITLYADEKEIVAVEGEVYLHLWYD